MTPNKKKFLHSFLIGLALTLLTAWSVTAAVRAAADALLRSVTDEALIDLLIPLQYLRFRISLLPTAIGGAVVSLPVYGIFKTKSTAARIGWIVLILFLLLIIWIISLFTLRIGLASMVKIFLTLLRTLGNLI